MEHNIFSYISDILFKKTQKYCKLTSEQLDFQPYMLQRWCSMASKDNVLILNETSNKWLSTFSDKHSYYQLVYAILPQQKQKRVAYIKKAAKSDRENNDIKDLSIAAELSQREIKEALNTLAYLQK